MSGKLTRGRVAFVLPAALAVVAGYGLGRIHGAQDALISIWNLRGNAECLDPSRSTGESSDPPLHSQWVWKRGERAGQPVDDWTDPALPNLVYAFPLLGDLGDRLVEHISAIDFASSGPVDR